MNETPQQPPQPDNSQRPPVNPQGVYAAPAPPPPGGGYQYAQVAPQAPKPSFFKTMTRIAVASWTLILVLGVGVFIGFYAGILMVAAQAGPVYAETYAEGMGENAIAIIPVYGMIEEGTAEFIRLAVDEAIADETIGAVVIHVESGGGTVGASERMYHDFQRLRDARPDVPIIASYGHVTASGGYYVSCHADYIFGSPSGISGSIGVLAQVPTMRGLMEDKLGIKWQVIEADSSPDKDTANNVFRDWNEHDVADVTKLLNAMHVRFKDIVHKGRVKEGGMTERQFAEVTTGNVYMNERAAELKLIDEVGYLEDAIAHARKEANLADDAPVVRYWVRAPGLLSMLAGAKSDPIVEMPDLDFDAKDIRQMVNELTTLEMMYLYRP